MPHSLRAKLGGLRYKGILEDKDYKRLCKALDNENVLEQIRDEIKELSYPYNLDAMRTKSDVLQIIDKYKAKSEE